LRRPIRFNVELGLWSDRRRNFALSLLFGLGALYGVPIVRSTLALLTFEADLIQAVLVGCALFFCLRGMRDTRVSQTQVPARNPRLYVIAGVALAVVAFAVALLVGKNP
jgi:hypothetical protein